MEVGDLVGAGACADRGGIGAGFEDRRGRHQDRASGEGGVVQRLLVAEVQFLVRESGSCLRDRFAQRRRGLGTVIRVAGRRPQHQGVEARAEPGPLIRGRRHILVDVAVRDLDGDVVGVRLEAGEHLVEHDADRVEIGASVCAGAGDQLRCDVAHGAHERLRGGGRAHGTGEAEVRELDLTVRAEQHVVGLEIAVDHLCGVDRLESREDRIEHDDGLSRSQRPPVAELLAQRDVGEVLHDQVHGVAVAAGVMHRDEGGVDEGRRGSCLSLEALDEALVIEQMAVHVLECDDAVQAQVGALVDHRHAAARHGVVDPVPVVEHLTDQRIGERGHRPPSARALSVRICTFAANRCASRYGPCSRTEASPW